MQEAIAVCTEKNSQSSANWGHKRDSMQCRAGCLTAKNSFHSDVHARKPETEKDDIFR